MPKLTKSQAERLVAEVGLAGDDVESNRRAVAAALGVLLGATASVGGPTDVRHWADLVRSAARRGGWDAARTDTLLAADPAAVATGGAAGRHAGRVLDALWDLAAELNERRGLGAAG